jgi:hypothetical protein
MASFKKLNSGSVFRLTGIKTNLIGFTGATPVPVLRRPEFEKDG